MNKKNKKLPDWVKTLRELVHESQKRNYKKRLTIVTKHL